MPCIADFKILMNKKFEKNTLVWIRMLKSLLVKSLRVNMDSPDWIPKFPLFFPKYSINL